MQNPEEEPKKPKRISRWENLQNHLKNPTGRLQALVQAFEEAPAPEDGQEKPIDTKTLDSGQNP